MAANIKFRKPHMTFIDGYFYMFDDNTDMLLQKTDDGITAFSYPFDTLLSSTVVACEYDGINFWTMQPGTVTNTLFINRWRIENYTCKLKTTFTLTSVDHKFSATSFTVEHYHCKLSTSCAPGATSIIIQSSDGLLPGLLQSGMTVTIGPNNYGYTETVDVQNVIGNAITLADPIENFYAEDVTVLYYNHIWLFNNYNGVDSSTGALYKLNAYSGSIITKYPGGEYKDVKASTFSEIDHFTTFGKVNSLMYVKASNLLFVNINVIAGKLMYYGSMAMDTIDDDKITVLDVYAISVYNKNLYRLQLKATYFGSTENYALDQLSYQGATFNQLAASLAMVAEPNIIPANGTSTSQLTAQVRDQFLQPLIGKIVYFTLPTGANTVVENGYIVGQSYQNTNAEGKAVVTYRAGTLAKVVPVIARVEQS